MTDKEKFLNLMKEFGIIVENGTSNSENGDECTVFEIYADNSPKQVGYMGFSCNWLFDIDGNFIKMGIWE